MKRCLLAKSGAIFSITINKHNNSLNKIGIHESILIIITKKKKKWGKGSILPQKKKKKFRQINRDGVVRLEIHHFSITRINIDLTKNH